MKKLMTHIVAGYPSLEENKQLVQAMERAGVQYVEIQIPFSDPIADGPTIMEANQKALMNGTTPEDAFNLMGDLSQSIKIPLLFMTYFNIIFHYGVEKFCKKAKEMGCYGLIVPDFPLEEENQDQLRHYCKKYGLVFVEMLTPYTKKKRIDAILKRAEGLIYCVARSGKTGVRENLDTTQLQFLKSVRTKTKVPLAIGFGISTLEHVDSVLQYGDIAVIGSKIITLYNEEKEEGKIEKIERFLRQIIAS